MIRFCVLTSGSKANSVYVEVDGVGVLLDCGYGAPALQKRLSMVNRSLTDIHHVFISHQHSDHVKGLAGLLKKHSCDIWTEKQFQDVMNEPVHVVNQGQKVFSITPFRLSHDEPCIGCTIQDSQGNKLGYVTDTGCIPEEAMRHLFDCHALIFEFNHDVELLTESPYPTELQERIFSDLGHMRNEESREIVSLLAWDGLKYLIPFHLSEQSNNEQLTTYEAKTAVLGFKCKVVCAKQNEPTDFFTVM